ncbi:MAG: GNAT family N-acetyltransferase [Verrucomicrobiaceae bacterium]|nr:GNAT family N-acetyltransferase [Verrucomicrobiaceae bacterium]
MLRRHAGCRGHRHHHGRIRRAPRLDLYSVAVHPEHRKQGIGSRLVVHAERAFTGRGCMKINLQIVAGNEAVAAFYESLGYAVEPRVSMGKRIQANIPSHDL